MNHLRYLFICIISPAPVRALAHGDTKELGHHWQSHLYIGEVHFQLIMMAALALVIFTAGMFMRKMKAKR
jgi:hypothetical protein